MIWIIAYLVMIPITMAISFYIYARYEDQYDVNAIIVYSLIWPYGITVLLTCLLIEISDKVKSQISEPGGFIYDKYASIKHKIEASHPKYKVLLEQQLKQDGELSPAEQISNHGAVSIEDQEEKSDMKGVVA